MAQEPSSSTPASSTPATTPTPTRPSIAIAKLLQSVDDASQASGIDEATLVQMLVEVQAVFKRHATKQPGK
jgi:hypothetical protein